MNFGLMSGTEKQQTFPVFEINKASHLSSARIHVEYVHSYHCFDHIKTAGCAGLTVACLAQPVK